MNRLQALRQGSVGNDCTIAMAKNVIGGTPLENKGEKRTDKRERRSGLG